MHARGLQSLRVYVVSLAQIISIHACARIATNRVGRPSVSLSYFDSCMREDCNPDLCYRKIAIFISIHACARIATPPGMPGRSRPAYFDSCMREDCNGIAAVRPL